MTCLKPCVWPGTEPGPEARILTPNSGPAKTPAGPSRLVSALSRLSFPASLPCAPEGGGLQTCSPHCTGEVARDQGGDTWVPALCSSWDQHTASRAALGWGLPLELCLGRWQHQLLSQTRKDQRAVGPAGRPPGAASDPGPGAGAGSCGGHWMDVSRPGDERPAASCPRAPRSTQQRLWEIKAVGQAWEPRRAAFTTHRNPKPGIPALEHPELSYFRKRCPSLQRPAPCLHNWPPPIL